MVVVVVVVEAVVVVVVVIVMIVLAVVAMIVLVGVVVVVIGPKPHWKISNPRNICGDCFSFSSCFLKLLRFLSLLLEYFCFLLPTKLLGCFYRKYN